MPVVARAVTVPEDVVTIANEVGYPVIMVNTSGCMVWSVDQRSSR
jgi:hypothetical protein